MVLSKSHICTPVFVAALFTVAKRWRQLWVNGWGRVVHPYKGTLFSLKKEGCLSYATTWINLGGIVLSGIE